MYILFESIKIKLLLFTYACALTKRGRALLEDAFYKNQFSAILTEFEENILDILDCILVL